MTLHIPSPSPSPTLHTIRGFSKVVFQRRNQICMLSVFTGIETICLNDWAKPQSKNVLRALQVDVRRSKTMIYLRFRNAERVQPAIFPEFENSI